MVKDIFAERHMGKESTFLIRGGGRNQGQTRGGKAHGNGILMVSDVIKYVGSFNGGKPNG